LSAARQTVISSIPDDVVRRRISLPQTGVEIAIHDWGGDGPLALLHHANGFCAGIWAPVAAPLRDRFRFVAMDARGHGDSTIPAAGVNGETFNWTVLERDLIAVAETLLGESGAARIELGVGHSFGGTMMLAAAAERPGLFGQLLLLDPVILPPMDAEGGRRHSEKTGLSKRARRRRSSWPDRATARTYFQERALFEHWTEASLELYLEEGLHESADASVELKCPGAVEAQLFEGAHTLNVFDKAERVTTPTHVHWARQGDFDRANYEKLVAPIPNATIEDVDVGHLIPMERPDIVVRTIEGLFPD